MDNSQTSQFDFKNEFKISARSSHLARLQAIMVGEELQSIYPELKIKYEFRESLGDKNLTDPLWKMPEKGVFTEDFYLDLIHEKTDCVVHSWKDLPVESKPDTEIAATLARADQRDILIFKRASLRPSDTIRLMTSSPRREYNLKHFLLKALPTESKNIEFVNVRGNVPTRLKKMMNDENVDGLVLAKAAVDRFLTSNWSEVFEVQNEIKSLFQSQLWMVLPLSVNPNAAAQGALAIEIKNSRVEIKNLLKKIHHEPVMQSVRKERTTLKCYGGGCHQKIGVSVFHREYKNQKYEIFNLKGLTDQGIILDKNEMTFSNSSPESLKENEIKTQIGHTSKFSTSALNALFESKSVDVDFTLDEKFVFVAKSKAVESLKSDEQKQLKLESQNQHSILWSAGLETWYKLAELGYWVSGSSESLGESEDPRVFHFLTKRQKQNYMKITHKIKNLQKNNFNKFSNLFTNNILLTSYELIEKVEQKQLKDEILQKIDQSQSLFVRSSVHFEWLLKNVPHLDQKVICCGVGGTLDYLTQIQNINPILFLNEQEYFNV